MYFHPDPYRPQGQSTKAEMSTNNLSSMTLLTVLSYVFGALLLVIGLLRRVDAMQIFILVTAVALIAVGSLLLGSIRSHAREIESDPVEKADVDTI